MALVLLFNKFRVTAFLKNLALTTIVNFPLERRWGDIFKSTNELNRQFFPALLPAGSQNAAAASRPLSF